MHQDTYFSPTGRPSRLPHPPRRPGQPAQPKRPQSLWKQIVFNVFSILLALYAVYEVLGVSSLFEMEGKSHDDAAIAFDSFALTLFFDPLGFAILLALLVFTFVIHILSKEITWYSDAVTRAGLITAAVAFVLSFFRVSMIFPAFFGGLGMMSAEIDNEPDVRTPAAQEFVLEPAQLIQYNDASGVRISTAVANNSVDFWQTATVAITYADAAGTVCGTHEQVEDYIGPGQQRAVTTPFLTAAIYYTDPSCVPATASAELVLIDVDSRSQIPPTDYAGTVPVFDSLMATEDPWIDGSTVKLSVTGFVAPGSLGALEDVGRLPVGFEVADGQGLRLSACFDADSVSQDGSFATQSFHSPLAPGVFHSVLVIPAGC